jgi:TldD protein
MSSPARAAFTVFFLSALFPIAAGAQAQPKDPVVLAAMAREVSRAMLELKKADPPPYFISYAVHDRAVAFVSGSDGALLNSVMLRRRMVGVTVRVGSPKLDNTHNENRASAMSTAALPLEDNPDAIARVLWDATDHGYKQSSETFLRVQAQQSVRAADDDKAPDFTLEKPQVHVERLHPGLADQRQLWEKKVRAWSAIFRQHPAVYNANVTLMVDHDDRYFASSEGSKVATPAEKLRILVTGETRADDGMELSQAQDIEVPSSHQLPDDATVMAAAEKVAHDLEKLRQAPPVDPYAGPALLSGRAAAVFFHEVLGHRIEGQRQRGDDEGQTFANKVNQRVLPEFLSVTDDPTLAVMGGTPLNGFYQFDDEGEPANAVNLIQDGVLKTFLLSRMPVQNFIHSNGHGRAEAGYMPTGRQGNLLVSSSRKTGEADLRRMLIEEARKRGQPYGLYFEDISGGFTLTRRDDLQAYQVQPTMVYRVYADGRADELVRGVNIVGTPLAALAQIVAAGDRTYVFNGICGAESGSVPVSAAAPAMLVSSLEVSKHDQGHTRPPVLAPPAAAVRHLPTDPVRP